MMRATTLAFAVAASLATLAPSAFAQMQEAPKLMHEKWSFDGPFGTYDRASAQRGFLVYKQVCSNCHALSLLSYRDLTDLGFSAEQVKSIAAEFTVPGGVNAEGEPVTRPALPADRFKSPFPNDQAARAANGGALPPDQSLIIKAREDGPNYVYSLLHGYVTPPKGMTIPSGHYYNKYFPGNLIAMPQPLRADQVDYTDGTKPTLDQESRDIVQFLTWASEPTMEQRKQMGVKVVLFLGLLTGLTYGVKRRIWKDVH